MSDNSLTISVLSSKAKDLLKRLDESYNNHDEPPNLSSNAQTVESKEYKNQITWILKKSNLNKTENGKSIKSPIVKIDFIKVGKLWMEIYPEEDPSHADITVNIGYVSGIIHVQCDISLKGNNRQDIWEDTYSGSLSEKFFHQHQGKIKFTNIFLGVDRGSNVSVEETLQIECRVKLFSTEYTCRGLQNYTVGGTSVINNYMEDILNSGKFSDVNLEVESTNIKAHKCILASESPSLRVLFKLNYGIKQALTNEKSEIFKDVLNYLYTGDIQISGFQHAWDLYITAYKYELLNLKNLCSVYLNANITESNISNIFDLSRNHKDEYLIKACLEFIKKSDTNLSTKIFLQNKFEK